MSLAFDSDKKNETANGFIFGCARFMLNQELNPMNDFIRLNKWIDCLFASFFIQF